MGMYIDMDTADYALIKKSADYFCHHQYAEQAGINEGRRILANISAADVVSREAYEQVEWERNMAVQQLAEIGKTIGSKMDDVRPVKRGRWIDKCVRDWRCSECGGEIDKVRHVDGYYYDNLPRYCPDCGAKMDKED